MFGALAIFVYVGSEVAIGNMLTNFLASPGVLGLELEAAEEGGDPEQRLRHVRRSAPPAPGAERVRQLRREVAQLNTIRTELGKGEQA